LMQVTSPIPEVAANEGSNPEYTIDGDTETYFLGPNYLTDHTTYLVYDFGVDVALTRVQLYQANFSYDASWELHCSDNGSTWTLLGSAGADVTTNVDFTLQSHRYWKVTETQGFVYSPWHLEEVRFFTSVSVWSPATPVTALDDLTDVDLTTTAPTTGDALVYDGADWVPTRPYPDTWLDALFARPSDETVHANDQEFDGTIGGTELTVSGTADWLQTGSRLYVEAASQTANDMAARIYSLTPTSAPVTIEAAIQIDRFPAEQFLMVGIFFSDGVTATDNVNTLFAYHQDNANAYLDILPMHGTFTNVATAETGISDQPSLLRVTFYLRLIWSASNTFKAQYSYNNIWWNNLDMSISDTLTPTHIGVFASTWSDAGPGQATFEYLRVTESDLSV
jgi:hypothetical protein